MTALEASSDVRIVIKKGFLSKSSRGTSLMGNHYWRSRFFSLEARYPCNAVPGPEHLSFLYTIKHSELKQIDLQNCTPDDVEVVTEEECQESRDTRIRKREHLFAINGVEEGKGPRRYYLEAINHEDMMSWVCRLKEYLSRDQSFAVYVEPNQGIQAGNALLTFRDNCLVLLSVLGNFPLGVWQLIKLVSFGLEGQTLWFNTEQTRPPTTLQEIKNLTLSDVEDYITLVVESQHTGPRIINKLIQLIQDGMNRAVVIKRGPGMAYTVKDDRSKLETSQMEASEGASHTQLKIPKPVYSRCSTSAPTSPSLAHKKMTCFECGDTVVPYHVTNLLVRSRALDDEIDQQINKRIGVQKKIQQKKAASLPRLRRKVSQVYFSKTSKADTARFVRRQTGIYNADQKKGESTANDDSDVEDDDYDDEDDDDDDDDDYDDYDDNRQARETEEEDTDNDKHERENDVKATLPSSSEHRQSVDSSLSRKISSCSSEDYTPMALVLDNFDSPLSHPEEEDASSESDEYVNMSFERSPSANDKEYTMDEIRNGISQ